ncbi:hypothetical protein G7050_08650 [Dysgonomonas sp. HDW5A]|uniref:hypothetical protein n=1 Tax=Dysgonomonas sp. HDW5A TaxID=2714926 RepID=UPI0014077CB0|nr:hypothetical protein [Dysgonomonas sp. HDW5A]QIK59892.1 hypothetical protein G7050_08650 [Dysgonomonas sp. HDW5A]
MSTNNFSLDLNFVAESELFTVNKNEESCKKLQEVMEEGARLIIKAYTDKKGYPTFWIEAIHQKRTDTFSVPAYNLIMQTVYNYLRKGTIAEINFVEGDYEKSKTEMNFSLRLFKAEVENGIRINTVSAFKGSKYLKAMTNHKKGQIHYNLERNEEFEGYLLEKNLI